jgi:cytochrome b561
MRRHSEAIKADVRRRMSPPNPQSVARISEEMGIHIATLYLWRMGWRLKVEVVPASQKDPEGWGAAVKFIVVLQSADFNATELSAYCRERSLYLEQVSHWQQVGAYLDMASVPGALGGGL